MQQFASFWIGKNLFGIDIRLIREINRHVDITPVDSAPAFIKGLLNLRGQIVTVIDIGVPLGIDPDQRGKTDCRCIVLKTSDELASKRSDDSTLEDTSKDLVALYIDSIGDMVMLDEKEVEPSPANTGEVEGRFIAGVATLEQELLIILKVGELLAMQDTAAK